MISRRELFGLLRERRETPVEPAPAPSFSLADFYRARESSDAGSEARTGITFPTLHDAILDPPMIDQLFFDIGAAAELMEVSLKRGATAHAEAAAPSLEEARAALAGGHTVGVQLRYRWGGNTWCDTLLRTPQGVRLVRVAVD